MTFKVQILGSNSSLPAYGRHHTSQIIQIGSQYFMVDCGEGTQYQIQKFGVKSSKIDHIMISHLHGDHFLGLMGMIYSFHLSGRTKTLNIYGQRGLNDIITAHLRASGSTLNYRIEFRVLDPENTTCIFENKILEIYSFPLKHRIPCCGFLFREKTKPRRINKGKLPKDFPIAQFGNLKAGNDIMDNNGQIVFRNADLTLEPHKSRSYAFCSDTAFDEELVDIVQGVDLLYHETTFLEEMKEWARKTFHATTKDASRIAQKAGVDKLLIGHFSARYKEIDIFVDECKTIFPSTYPALEGEIYEIEE